MIDVALPVGLATAELVGNSLEHGLSGEGGIVCLSVRRLPGGRISARVADDGSRRPASSPGSSPGPGASGAEKSGDRPFGRSPLRSRAPAYFRYSGLDS
jgi:two-component sensor histidine kinase